LLRTKIFFSSEGGETAQAVIEFLPVFLHHFGPIGLPLVLELVEQAIDSKETRVIRKLAEKSGILLCCMTYKTRVQRNADEETLVILLIKQELLVNSIFFGNFNAGQRKA
jgi:hypothetical protein